MNVYYYQRQIGWWRRWDGWLRLIAALASSTAAVAVLGKADPNYVAALAFAGAIAVAATPILGFTNYIAEGSAVLASYVRLMHDAEHVYATTDADSPYTDAIKALAADLRAIEVSEGEKIGTANVRVLRWAQDEMEISIGHRVRATTVRDRWSRFWTGESPVATARPATA